LRRLRQKISSIYCTVICNYPSAAQELPFTVGLFCITKTDKLTRCALLVFVRSCSNINNKIISFKNLFHHRQLGAPHKKSGALGTCPVCPLVKTAPISALEMASPGNQHCPSCIGTLSFPIVCVVRESCRPGARFGFRRPCVCCGYKTLLNFKPGMNS